jgi:DNA-binding NtrC family response regulator
VIPGHVLVVDDDQSLCELIARDLSRRGAEATWYTAAEDAFVGLMQGDFDVVLTDLSMPGWNGIELCDRVATNRPDVPVVVLTAFGSIDAAVGAIRAGAYDFVMKPIDLDLLALSLERALRHRRLQEQVKVLSEVARRSGDFDEIVGESAPMLALYDQIEKVARSDATVLVTGESGTGKELVARALHRRSARAAGPYLAVNCAALPAPLLESELFGHARGAYTGATAARDGLFLEARNGTLFLDEIGDLPLDLQPKLLRVLEEHCVRRLGTNAEVPVDVRVIAATNRDLQTAVDEGRFREDLYFRINVIQLELPPLRARGGDVLLLAQRFLEAIAGRSGKPVTGLSKPVAEKLLQYGWPGNVRELRNAVERAVALTRFETLAVEDLPERIRAYRRSDVLLSSDDPSELATLEEVERRYILHVLRAVGGNRTLAARVLGVGRKTLYRKLLRYGPEAAAEPAAPSRPA